MIEIDEYRKKVEEATNFLGQRLAAPPEIVIALGTGLGGLCNSVTPELTLPYSQIPHFPRATVESHAGNLVFGTIGSKRVAVLQGRFHYYEGYSARELTLPLRVLSLLGPSTLIVTNAAGGLDNSFAPGTIMIIRDHLNFIGDNPLRGPNIDSWGPRFPDLSEPYDPGLINRTMSCAIRHRVENVTTGIYAAIPGPSLETPAETRFLQGAGADAVGMSTVPEVLVARHAGLKVLGLSIIANVNDPDNFQPIILQDIVEAAAKAGTRVQLLITELIKEM